MSGEGNMIISIPTDSFLSAPFSHKGVYYWPAGKQEKMKTENKFSTEEKPIQAFPRKKIQKDWSYHVLAE